MTVDKNQFSESTVWIVSSRTSGNIPNNDVKWDWNNFTEQIISIYGMDWYTSCKITNESSSGYVVLQMYYVSEANKYQGRYHYSPSYFMDLIQKCANENDIKVRVTISSMNVVNGRRKNTSQLSPIEIQVMRDVAELNEDLDD